nr:hypothetical protein [Tanacetum cinerariifolium]
PTIVEVPKELPKVSMVNTSLKKLKHHLAALRDALRKLKGKTLADNAVISHYMALEMLNVDVEPLNPRLLKNRSAHSDYLKHTQEEAASLREIVEQEKSKNPLNAYLDYVCNACPLTRITTIAEVPFRKPIALESDTPKPVVTLVYSKETQKIKNNVSVSKSKNIKSLSTNKKEPDKSEDLQFPMFHLLLLMNAGLSKLFSARQGLVRGFSKLNFEKYHLCYACAMGKRKKKHHKPKSKDTNQEKLYLLHMYLCGPMRVASINEKKYILVIVDDYSRFTWVKCLRSKDEALDFIFKFLKIIKVRLKVHVRRIRIDNGIEFVNQTLREYYEQAEGVATACYTQNRSIVRLRHDKTPYEILHDKLPDLSFFYVFGALCYPTNDNFDELTGMASEQSSSGPALHKITPATISSGLVPNPPSSTPFLPPSRTNWDMLFQPLFDELITPLPNVVHPAPKVIAPITEVVALEPAASIGSPSSRIVDQDAPSPSNSQTTP